MNHSNHFSLSCLLLLLLHSSPLLAFNPDVSLLLSFKYSIISDPLNVLSNWGYFDSSPCSWNGVVCTGFPLSNITQYTNNTKNETSNSTTDFNSSDMWVPTVSRVISLILPNSQLLGPISPDLGLLTHLRHLDLSGNLFNGSLPSTLFNATELQVLSLSNNELSGQLNDSIGQLKNLKVLNLNGNAFTGNIQSTLRLLRNLTDLSLSNNYFHGKLPSGGFDSLETLDLSSNLLNGTVPVDFGGKNLKYLNLSTNHLTGSVPSELGTQITPNATVDFSFNNLSGPIPQTGAFVNQKETAFVGNTDLCGAPLENLCTIPSSLSNPPNPKEAKSPPAFAAIPKNSTVDSPVGSSRPVKQGGLRVFTILAIAAGDLAGIAILAIVFMYVYHVKKKKSKRGELKQRDGKREEDLGNTGDKNREVSSLCCLKKKNKDETESSECSTCSETEEETPKMTNNEKMAKNVKSKMEKNPIMVTLDGPELEMETLLKASAYILGAAGQSIVYKAVLSGGTTLVVRRIGENLSGNGVEKLKDFEIYVKSVARFKHPNLLRIRGFYWGPEEKLLICDYAPNGSLANISLRRKQSSSPLSLNWNTRIRIIKGVARGLSYLHEKKQIHGNIKPSNILLGFEFEPLIGDFGLDKLTKPDLLTKPFGSKRSALSLPDLSPPPGASPFAGSSSFVGSVYSYQAPESLKNIKQSPKWDIYSFGVVLLELLTGRVFTEVEICQWNLNGNGFEADRVLKMVDPYLRGEIKGKEEGVLSWFKLGLDCCAMLPQKRPSMKDVMQVLDRLPYSS
ncbi:hypothetical protein LUZ60_008782 [Juncus effusus]|nr:hypothetical protein LUZ60_008782 [Juncus effusus]